MPEEIAVPSGTLSPDQLKYLSLLAEQYPSEEALCTEITRLNARMSLPKGTEHFMSDIHGEYEAFAHIMNNCSGVIREKVNMWLGYRLTGTEADELCRSAVAGVDPHPGGTHGFPRPDAVLQVYPGNRSKPDAEGMVLPAAGADA